jgi:hypothetical protein
MITALSPFYNKKVTSSYHEDEGHFLIRKSEVGKKQELVRETSKSWYAQVVTYFKILLYHSFIKLPTIQDLLLTIFFFNYA